jgi:hypothetical protein
MNQRSKAGRMEYEEALAATRPRDSNRVWMVDLMAAVSGLQTLERSKKLWAHTDLSSVNSHYRVDRHLK